MAIKESSARAADAGCTGKTSPAVEVVTTLGAGTHHPRVLPNAAYLAEIAHPHGYCSLRKLRRISAMGENELTHAMLQLHRAGFVEQRWVPSYYQYNILPLPGAAVPWNRYSGWAIPDAGTSRADRALGMEAQHG